MNDTLFRSVCIGILLTMVFGIPRESLATSYCVKSPPCEFVLNPTKTAFVGRVVGNAVGQPEPGAFYHSVTTFAVEEVFGADVGQTVTVLVNTEESPQAARTLFLPRGVSFLVYAESDGDGQWGVATCSRPLRLDEARRDLEVLRAARNAPPVSSLGGTVSLLTWEQGSLEWAPGITIRATPQDNGRDGLEAHETLSDEQGRFRFLGLPPGQYRIAPQVALPLKPRFEDSEVVRFHSCRHDVSVFLTTAAFSGTVRGADGAPVAGTEVQVTEAGEPEYQGLPRAPAFTDRNGRWVLDGVPDGAYVIGVNVRGGPSAQSPYPPTWYPGVQTPNAAEVVVLDGSRPRQVDLTMPAPLPSGTIVGTVLDRAGNPAPRATIQVYDAAFPDGSAAFATADADGRFTVAALLGRQLTIVASHAGFVSTALPITLAAGPGSAASTVEVRLSTTQEETNNGKR